MLALDGLNLLARKDQTLGHTFAAVIVRYEYAPGITCCNDMNFDRPPSSVCNHINGYSDLRENHNEIPIEQLMTFNGAWMEKQVIVQK